MYHSIKHIANVIYFVTFNEIIDIKKELVNLKLRRLAFYIMFGCFGYFCMLVIQCQR